MVGVACYIGDALLGLRVVFAERVKPSRAGCLVHVLRLAFAPPTVLQVAPTAFGTTAHIAGAAVAVAFSMAAGLALCLVWLAPYSQRVLKLLPCFLHCAPVLSILKPFYPAEGGRAHRSRPRTVAEKGGFGDITASACLLCSAATFVRPCTWCTQQRPCPYNWGTALHMSDRGFLRS